MLDIKEIERMLDSGEVVEFKCIDLDGFLSDQEWSDKNKEILSKEKIIAEAIIGPPKYNRKAVGLMGNGAISEGELKYFKIKEKSYTEKFLDRDSKFKELLSVATKAVNDSDLSSFTVTRSKSSGKIGGCLYIGANMAYHAIENEIKGLEMKEKLEVKEEIKTSEFDVVVDSAFKALKDGVIKEIGLDRDILMIMKYRESERKYISKGEVIQNGNCKYLEYIDSLYTETFVIEGFHDTKALKKGDKAVLGNGEEVIFSNRTGVNGALWFEYNDCHRAIIPFIALKGATVTQQKGNK